MEETHRAVEDMRKVLCQLRSNAEGEDRRGSEIQGLKSYAESIRWKLRFLHHYCGFLNGVQWADVCRLGTPGFGDPVRVACGESSEGGPVVLEVRTQDSGRMMVLTAFDGIVAACVNSADTLGRMLNLAYRLGLEERNANLPMVAQKVQDNCTVDLILKKNPGIDWMSPVRLLRGECQHGNIAAVIREPDRAFGVPTDDLLVADTFAIDGQKGMAVGAYSMVLRDRTLLLLRAVAHAVTADPIGAIVPKGTAPV
jgi:hypothetical protein